MRGIVPLFLLFAPMEFVHFRWTTACFHLAFGMTLSVLLTELLFIGFHKAPFTCSYLAGKVNLVGLGVVYIFGFTMYSSTMAGVEEWLGHTPIAAVSFFAAAAAGWIALMRSREASTSLEFEDAGDPDVRTLELEA